MDNGFNSTDSGVTSEPPSLDCRAAHSMLDAGARRLTDEALQELASHLDQCRTCSTRFSEILPDSPGPEEVAVPVGAVSTRSRELLARVAREVLGEYHRRREAAPLTLIHTGSSRSTRQATADTDWQLTPGWPLHGDSQEFVVTDPIRRSDFTETYAAELVVRGTQSTNRRRVVIKIPRIGGDMSPDAAIERLRLLRLLIRAHAHELQNLVGLREVAQMIDCGQYTLWLQDRSTESTFIAYEYIDGLELAEYMARHHPHAESDRFEGLATATTFAHWARALTKGLLQIHNRLALHGDVCPRNVLVTEDGRPVFIDVGQAFFREVMNGGKAFSTNFSFSTNVYRAPEGLSTPSSDLFSLGGLLFFLATGKEPVGFANADNEVLKQQIALKIKEANPALYQDDVGVADIIAMCLRTDGRIQHAGRLLCDIDTFWPESTATSLLDEMKALAEPATTLEASGNSVFLSVANSHIRSLRRVLVDMGKHIFDANGSASDIRSAAYALIGTLRAGDEFVTVSLPAFWHPENIGINGRFLSMCRNAAARGASVKRVFLLTREDCSDPRLQKIVAAQLNAATDLDSPRRSNFGVRFWLVSPEQRRQLVASGRHFGLLVKGGDRIAMFPVYDTNERLVTLRFRSGSREVAGLREAFENIWSTHARPLADLQLPSRALDAIEKHA